jgi:lipopolysaccharide biosynthesis protein
MPAPFCFAWRNLIFSFTPSLFTNVPVFENWKKAHAYFISQRSSQIELINLAKLPIPPQSPSKKIAIQAHIFYSDLAPELSKLLQTFPQSFDLLISTPHDADEKYLRKQFAHLPHLQKIHIRITPNRGRDLGPLLFGYGSDLLQYDYFAHIHTKKSAASNDIGYAWREYLWGGLLNNSQQQVSKILGLLERYGLVYPQKFPLIDVQNCQWGDNLNAAKEICNVIKIADPQPGFVEFPVGSMFWANTSALKPLLAKPFTLEDFEPEQGQTDHTIMHAIERLLTHTALTQGYPIGLLQSPSVFSYYP